jgi:hypothetical protein
MTINMGNAVIVNPLTDTTMQFPLIGLHYLSHGRFAYAGDANSGEIDAIELANVLDTSTRTSPSPPRPSEYQLFLCNYPNPFNAGTQIQFSLPQDGHTSLRIFNINGQLVCSLLDEHLAAGDHLVRWDGRDRDGQRVASGIYFCRLEHDEAMLARKMMLVK